MAGRSCSDATECTDCDMLNLSSDLDCTFCYDYEASSMGGPAVGTCQDSRLQCDPGCAFHDYCPFDGIYTEGNFLTQCESIGDSCFACTSSTDLACGWCETTKTCLHIATDNDSGNFKSCPSCPDLTTGVCPNNHLFGLNAAQLTAIVGSIILLITFAIVYALGEFRGRWAGPVAVDAKKALLADDAKAPGDDDSPQVDGVPPTRHLSVLDALLVREATLREMQGTQQASESHDIGASLILLNRRLYFLVLVVVAPLALVVLIILAASPKRIQTSDVTWFDHLSVGFLPDGHAVFYVTFVLQAVGLFVITTFLLLRSLKGKTIWRDELGTRHFRSWTSTLRAFTLNCLLLLVAGCIGVLSMFLTAATVVSLPMVPPFMESYLAPAGPVFGFVANDLFLPMLVRKAGRIIHKDKHARREAYVYGMSSFLLVGSTAVIPMASFTGIAVASSLDETFVGKTALFRLILARAASPFFLALFAQRATVRVAYEVLAPKRFLASFDAEDNLTARSVTWVNSLGIIIVFWSVLPAVSLTGIVCSLATLLATQVVVLVRRTPVRDVELVSEPRACRWLVFYVLGSTVANFLLTFPIDWGTVPNPFSAMPVMNTLLGFALLFYFVLPHICKPKRPDEAPLPPVTSLS